MKRFYRHGYPGSAFKELDETNPDRQYFKEGKKFEEWFFVTELPNEEWKIIRKSVPTQQERVFSFIESFEDIFSEQILLDAKRLAYYIKVSGRIFPSTMAVSCVYIALEMRGRLNEFKDKDTVKKMILALSKVREGKYILGERVRDRTNWSPDKQNVHRFCDYVKNKAEHVKKNIDQEVFDSIKKIWEATHENGDITRIKKTKK